MSIQSLEPTEWEATFTYDLDDRSGDPVDFEQRGLYAWTVDCDGRWRLTSSSNGTTANPDDIVEYAIDSSAGRLGYFERIDGSVERREYACNIYTSPMVNPELGTWSTDEECRADGPAEDDDEDVDATDVGLAPGDPEKEVFPAHDPGPHDCVVGAGATVVNTDGFIPYTGRIEATLADGAGHRSVRVVHDMLAGVAFGNKDDDHRDGVGAGSCTTNDCRLVAGHAAFAGELPEMLTVGHYKGWTEGQ